MKCFTILFVALTLIGCSSHTKVSAVKGVRDPALTDLWKSANTAYSNQQWQDSYYLHDQISKQMTDAEIEFKKGVSAFRMGKIKLAESTFEKALEINPNHQKTLYNLAVINISSGYLFLYKYQETLPIQDRSERLSNILKSLEKFSQH